ncbi:hypothetical protein B0H11DRAFT_63285 [Mycena galericulata]|nr:hypothetical protein B0H11DRAFT_63285 [Mycena galericulata]
MISTLPALGLSSVLILSCLRLAPRATAQATTVPQCALGCARQAAIQVGCAITDTPCLCKTTFASSVLQCVRTTSCSAEEQTDGEYPGGDVCWVGLRLGAERYIFRAFQHSERQCVHHHCYDPLQRLGLRLLDHHPYLRFSLPAHLNHLKLRVPFPYSTQPPTPSASPTSRATSTGVAELNRSNIAAYAAAAGAVIGAGILIL